MYNSTHTSNENINTLRQPLIDRINQILLSIPIDQFADVTDTIFNLLNVSQVSSTEHVTSNTGDELKNIRVNKQYIKEMVDISLLEQHTTESYLNHIEKSLIEIAEKHTKHFVKFNKELLKYAIYYPTALMLRNSQFPIPPLSDVQTDDPNYIHNTISFKDSPYFDLINHFDDNSNIIDTTYIIIDPGRREVFLKINETTKELIFLFDNNIKDPSKQTDIDLFIHDLVVLIKEIFTYLNTSYQYRKNSLSLKSLKTK